MTPADQRLLQAWQISRGLPLAERYDLIERIGSSAAREGHIAVVLPRLNGRTASAMEQR